MESGCVWVVVDDAVCELVDVECGEEVEVVFEGVFVLCDGVVVADDAGEGFLYDDGFAVWLSGCWARAFLCDDVVEFGDG